MKNFQPEKWQLTSLVTLRVLIGWHFLYEGLVKLIDPDWSAASYLIESQWLFKGFFHSLAGNATSLAVVDFLNVWGLILIGLGLFLGCFTRISSIGGIVLLAFYYISHPSFLNLEYALPSEGNYLIVNKTLIELIAIWVIYLFPTGRIIGIDRFIFSDKE